MARERDPIASLIQTYHELNPTTVDELTEAPTALEFMRYVARNRPFVVRGGAADWPAVQKWNASYLNEVMQDRTVQVAITPHGNADAVVETADGTLVFAEPHEISEPFSTFLASIQSSSCSFSRSPSDLPTPPPQHSPIPPHVRYAQTQNDNLRGEYFPLFRDVPPTIPFASAGLSQQQQQQQPGGGSDGAGPDAVNFWLGTSRSTTALHKDNYENIYVQVRGAKHFTLLPPLATACVNERALRVGRYRPRNPGGGERQDWHDGEGEGGDGWEIVMKTGEGGEGGGEGEGPLAGGGGVEIPVAVWDPDEPGKRATPYAGLARPARVSVREGDVLYLPAMWYHKVTQSEGEEGFACSVNYWYDMEFGGGFWATNAFIREVTLNAARQVDYPPLVMGGEDDESDRAHRS